MTAAFDKSVRRAIRLELARESYASNRVRLVDTELAWCNWLVTTHRGLFAVSPEKVALVAHGWFFGIDLAGPQLFYFENCAMRYRAESLGRIVRLDWDGARLTNPQVIVSGLHGNCHQLKVIDDLICLVDTANQRILRFTRDGEPVDQKAPFPIAPNTDTSGAYLHINSIARVNERIALLLHNGKAPGPRKSELAWLDQDWNLIARADIDGYNCHDIVADAAGTLWHSASQSGEVIADDGRRITVGEGLMTRAIAFHANTKLVGLSSFGERQVRDALAGQVVIFNGAWQEIARHELPVGPADSVAVR